MKVAFSQLIALFRRGLAPLAIVALLAVGTSLLSTHRHGEPNVASPDCAACVIAQTPADPGSVVIASLAAPLEKGAAQSAPAPGSTCPGFSYAVPLACGPPAA